MDDILLSASNIKDFIACDAKWYYRRYHSDESISTPEMILGKVIHAAIEKFWDNLPAGLEYLQDEYRLFDFDISLAERMLDNYFNSFRSMLSPGDEIEKYFSIPLYGKNVKLVGKIDRIVSGTLILDWKTSKSFPKNLSYDPQFILYRYAFKYLYGNPPSDIFYVSLNDSKLFRFDYKKDAEDILLTHILPTMISRIRSKKFPPVGLYKNICGGCVFKNICWNNLGIGKEML